MPEMPLLLIEIGIDPILFTIGSVDVSWHAVMFAFALAVGVGASAWFSKGTGIKKGDVYSLAPWAILGGMVGARLFHVLDCLDYYAAHPPQILEFWSGLSVLGGILGGTLATILYNRVTHTSFGRLADVIAPGLLLAQAVGRIGCTINGDVYGAPTSLPWAFVYTHPNAATSTKMWIDQSQGIRYAGHPSPVYEIIWDLIVFAIIWKLRGKLKPDGSLFLLYLCLYFTGRFGIEFTRAVEAGQTNVAGILHAPHFIALITLAVCVPTLIYRMRKAKATV